MRRGLQRQAAASHRKRDLSRNPADAQLLKAAVIMGQCPVCRITLTVQPDNNQVCTKCGFVYAVRGFEIQERDFSLEEDEQN